MNEPVGEIMHYSVQIAPFGEIKDGRLLCNCSLKENSIAGQRWSFLSI